MENKRDSLTHPFIIELDRNIDFEEMVIRVYFGRSFPDKGKFKEAIVNWAERGIEEGYGDGFMSWIDDETDEDGEGGLNWDEEKKWVEIYVGMDDISKKEAKNRALDAFYRTLEDFNQVKKVKIGSGFEW